MYTVIIACVVACGVFASFFFGLDWGMGWSVTMGVVGFGAFQFIVGRQLQKRIKVVMERVQEIMVAGQKAMQEKTQRWQWHPPSSQAAAEKMLRDDLTKVVQQAIDETAKLEAYIHWVPLMARQIATARLQLSWMVQDFKTVDALLPKALLVDPNLVAIKMARLYMTNGDRAAIVKAYQKGVSRVRYNGNVLLAATMSWMQVQWGDADAAFKTLTEALKKSDDATLKRNHAELMNNRAAHFPNSGLGETWYALQLEKPKVRQQRMRPVYR